MMITLQTKTIYYNIIKTLRSGFQAVPLCTILLGSFNDDCNEIVTSHINFSQ